MTKCVCVLDKHSICVHSWEFMKEIYINKQSKQANKASYI